MWLIAQSVGWPRVETGLLALLPLETDDTLGDIGLTIRASEPPSPALREVLSTLRAAASTRAAKLS